MGYVKDFKWGKNLSVRDFVKQMGGVGFQSIELERASDIIVKMKESKAKIFLTFTSNMVTSGLRGFFAQIVSLGMVDAIVTTVGGIEEDIMKAHGERFPIGTFRADDIALHEEGTNRVGNIYIHNKSYEKFEETAQSMLKELYKKGNRWAVSDMLKEMGLMLKDEDSILYQAAKKNVPIYCPAITDGSFGFHAFMFQEDHPDFVIDVVKDFGNMQFYTTHDERKGIIALGGGVSKHQALLACLLTGGFDYAVYITTARESSGSVSGATTEEAKSWGKINDSSDACTVIGDVSVIFPLVMIKALEDLREKGIIRG
jgi:deoxyhypusine synthase